MECPYCRNPDTKVTDKRDSGQAARRRRECLKCGKRFTTYERVELDIGVIKKDGKREAFNRSKLFAGISKSLEKRPITSDEIESLVNSIESRVYRTAKDKDITSRKIGEIIMNKLKRLDTVAYIRFASVYRDFADIDDFRAELKNLK